MPDVAMKGLLVLARALSMAGMVERLVSCCSASSGRVDAAQDTTAYLCKMLSSSSTASTALVRSWSNAAAHAVSRLQDEVPEC